MAQTSLVRGVYTVLLRGLPLSRHAFWRSEKISEMRVLWSFIKYPGGVWSWTSLSLRLILPYRKSRKYLEKTFSVSSVLMLTFSVCSCKRGQRGDIWRQGLTFWALHALLTTGRVCLGSPPIRTTFPPHKCSESIKSLRVLSTHSTLKQWTLKI